MVFRASIRARKPRQTLRLRPPAPIEVIPAIEATPGFDLQAADGGGAGSFSWSATLLTKKNLPTATTFRNTTYIERLNRTLHLERRAYVAYQAFQRRSFDHPSPAVATEAHRQATKDLIRLIIASRGIPADRRHQGLRLTRALIRLCAQAPSELARQLTFATLGQLERRLERSYERLLKLAPQRDIPMLRELLRRTELNAAALNERGRAK